MKCDVAIIGAGPYGLSAVAHLRTIKGLDIRVFGKPMFFWEHHMPQGMLLRSGWTATHIAHPTNQLTLEAFRDASGNHLSHPVPLDRFVQYGQWYQRQAVADLDRRQIRNVETNSCGFHLVADDGEAIHARRVVVAAGIGLFAKRPQLFQTLPSSLASHTSEHSDLSRFAGKQVLIVGGGQSALESAALLHEKGAQVEVITRSHRIHWLQAWLSRTLHHRSGSVVRRLLYAPTDVGPAGLSQLMARPDLLNHVPRRLRNKLWERSVRPAGAGWLAHRLKNVPIRLGRSVLSVVVQGERVKVRLDDGTEPVVHHVLLGTGYRVDISKYDFLSPKLRESISSYNGYPRLRDGLETSVDGLHILGAPAAWSFGPLMQFVSGTRYASRSLVRRVVGTF
jgi:cation diffusion facilitator CzcD-associated flavoprotein CzcO